MATKISEPRDLFLHELGDALTFEKTIEKMLPKLQKEASDEQLATGFERHREQTRRHIQNVEQAFKALGERPKAEKCPGIEGIKAEHDEFVRQGASPQVLDAFLTGAAARVEHYEIATYESLVAMAKAMGENEAAQLLDENLKQDKEVLKEVQTIGKRLAKQGAKSSGGARGEARTTGRGGGRTTGRETGRTTRGGGGRRVGKMNPIEVQKHLKGMSYPASKDDIVSTAQGNGADDALLEQLRGMNEKEFTGPDDVMEALGKST